jgi:hypothetical protein
MRIACFILCIALSAAASSSFTFDVELKLQNQVTGFNRSDGAIQPWLTAMALHERRTPAAISKLENRPIRRAADLDHGLKEWEKTIAALVRLRQNLVDLLPAERNQVADVLDERIADAVRTARAMDAVVGAVLSTVRNEGQHTIILNAGLLSGRPRTLPVVSAPVA